MKFVIFRERFFSDTRFIIELFKKSNGHGENVQKMVIFKAKCPKNVEFQGIFFFAFFASFSLRRIFFAEIFSLRRILCLLTSILQYNMRKFRIGLSDSMSIFFLFQYSLYGKVSKTNCYPSKEKSIIFFYCFSPQSVE